MKEGKDEGTENTLSLQVQSHADLPRKMLSHNKTHAGVGVAGSRRGRCSPAWAGVGVAEGVAALPQPGSRSCRPWPFIFQCPIFHSKQTIFRLEKRNHCAQLNLNMAQKVSAFTTVPSHVSPDRRGEVPTPELTVFPAGASHSPLRTTPKEPSPSFSSRRRSFSPMRQVRLCRVPSPGRAPGVGEGFRKVL